MPRKSRGLGGLAVSKSKKTASGHKSLQLSKTKTKTKTVSRHGNPTDEKFRPTKFENTRHIRQVRSQNHPEYMYPKASSTARASSAFGPGYAATKPTQRDQLTSITSEPTGHRAGGSTSTKSYCHVAPKHNSTSQRRSQRRPHLHTTGSNSDSDLQGNPWQNLVSQTGRMLNDLLLDSDDDDDATTNILEHQYENSTTRQPLQPMYVSYYYNIEASPIQGPPLRQPHESLKSLSREEQDSRVSSRAQRSSLEPSLDDHYSRSMNDLHPEVPRKIQSQPNHSSHLEDSYASVREEFGPRSTRDRCEDQPQHVPVSFCTSTPINSNREDVRAERFFRQSQRTNVKSPLVKIVYKDGLVDYLEGSQEDFV